jgi:hypothetical protein
VRRAQVRATAGGAGVARLASTDAEGRFELRDLPAGQWALTASKPGYVTQRLGQRRPYETVPPIELADGQRFSGATFALARGGAITGRVFDDFGDAVANARVQVLRSQFVNGRRRLNPVAGSDESDDTGAFRLYGLAPGDYYVSATLRTNPFETSADQTGYSPTYFPGTGNITEAQRITLGVGDEQSVSFALQPVRTVRVSGVVISSMGAGLGGGIVALTGDADEAPLDTATGGRIAADGAFTIANVAPGSYLLSVRGGGGGGGLGAGGFGGRGGAGGGAVAALGGADAEVASFPVTVGTQDVTGLTDDDARRDDRRAGRGGRYEHASKSDVAADLGARPPCLSGWRGAQRTRRGRRHLSPRVAHRTVRRPDRRPAVAVDGEVHHRERRGRG